MGFGTLYLLHQSFQCLLLGYFELPIIPSAIYQVDLGVQLSELATHLSSPILLALHFQNLYQITGPRSVGVIRRTDKAISGRFVKVVELTALGLHFCRIPTAFTKDRAHSEAG